MKMFENIKLRRFSAMLLVCILLSMVAVEVAYAHTSIVDDYPELKPLADFVGEENLSVLHLTGFKASKRAMSELGFKKGDLDVLVLTDAGYIAKIGDYTTEKALDGVIVTSGASRGNGNLVNLHKPYNAPLWFAFFDKKSKDCVYLEVKSEVLKTYLDKERVDREAALRDFMELKDEEIFSKIAKENIDADRLLSDPEAWRRRWSLRYLVETSSA